MLIVMVRILLVYVRRIVCCWGALPLSLPSFSTRPNVSSRRHGWPSVVEFYHRRYEPYIVVFTIR